MDHNTGDTPDESELYRLDHNTEDTPDVSEYINFGPYDWVTYKQNAGLGKIQIGWWPRVSHRVGKLIYYWIRPEPGIESSFV